jgi:hypothetical protein
MDSPIFLSIERKVGKRLERQTNVWLYEFKCSEPGCDKVFAVPRAQVSRHCGFCNKHWREKGLQRLRKLDTMNFSLQNSGLQDL